MSRVAVESAHPDADRGLRIARSLRARFATWIEARQGRDEAPVTLHRRRIYILPTRIGLVYASACFVLLLGALNFDNNLGLALAFTLASLGLTAMHRCQRNLLGLVVQGGGAPPVFAGQIARFSVTAYNASTRDRLQIRLRLNADTGEPGDIPGGQQQEIGLDIPTAARGVLTLARFTVTTTHPLALFRAWSWLSLPLRCVVYPRPDPANTRPPASATRAGFLAGTAEGDEDFAGLRPLRQGDSPRRIAWKTASRGLPPMVKQFGGGGEAPLWLRWDALPELPAEQRISRLCRWVLDAEQEGRVYGLELPGKRIPPARGQAHRHRCLRELAILRL
jgi:uncharacterized protein (DUF58 family)